MEHKALSIFKIRKMAQTQRSTLCTSYFNLAAADTFTKLNLLMSQGTKFDK